MMRQTRRHTRQATLILLAAAALLAWSFSTACTPDRPSYEQVYNMSAEYHALGSEASDDQRARLIADIERADRLVELAVSTLDDQQVAQALVDAAARGVDVRVVSDWDMREADGLTLLEDNDIFPVYGDGELLYLPEPTIRNILADCGELADRQFVRCSSGQGGGQGSMVRPGHYNLMSHNFAIIDERTVWNFPAIDASSQPWVGWRVDDHMLAYDFGAEFQQMHGGVFATTVDKYNGPVKSTTDAHVSYLTDEGMMSVWFNPQERLMKTVIDRAYKAKASLWVMSDNITNPHLLDALEYKADNGFDVRVMVHPDYQAGGEAQRRLENLDARYAPEGVDHLPNLIIIDSSEDRNGDTWGREVLGLSHQLLRGAAFEIVPSSPSDRVHIYPADSFIDGNLWMLREQGAAARNLPTLDQFEQQWLDIWGDAR